MKRVLEFVICLLIVVSVAYIKPIISSHYQTKPKDDLSVEEVKVSHKSVPYYELNTTGMANYIGESESDFLNEFSEPKTTYDSFFNKKWLVYGSSTEDYFQVEISDGIVSSIVVLGSKVASEPFSMGMNLADIGEITTIFSNFKFDYQDETYDLELTEDDMNFCPLVAFNNGTFALLHINQGNGQLMAIRYLDKKSLLILMPYQLTQENKVRASLTNESENWNKINEDNRNQLFGLLNLLRQKEGQETYKMSSSLQSLAGESLSILQNKPEDVIKDSNRLNEFKNVIETHSLMNTFTMDTKEMENLLEILKLNTKETHSIFYYPVLDVPFMLTSWYSNYASYDELSGKDSSLVGISFDKQMVMTYIGQNDEVTKTIESSE